MGFEIYVHRSPRNLPQQPAGLSKQNLSVQSLIIPYPVTVDCVTGGQGALVSLEIFAVHC